ncbi:MAG: hypothetical protein COA45_05320 [Zetaproteobacteria bacterium]|nr:MAG: hypothetical protein COA45_05320 [Zetaproteobacteria bacterium]
MKKILVLIVMVVCLFAEQVYAWGEVPVFTVFLNDLAYTNSGKVRPCYPLYARFEHPNPEVTKVRMRHPTNHVLFMHFPINQNVHIKIHEQYMKQGLLSISDFIAEDNYGHIYGQMNLTFIPVDPAHGNICDGYVNS